MEKTTNSHIKSIDSIKFLFSIIIVYFHLFHVQLRPYLSDSTLFQILTIRTFSAQLIVECFLITAGYFLFQTYLNTPKTSIANFFIKRFFRLWPVFFFYNIIIYFQTPTTLDELILNISFLHSTGISQNYYGAIWFISPFFWSGLLLFSILKSFERNKALIIISLITYFSYCINLNNLQGGVGRHVVYSFLSLAMLRTLGGLSLGILLGASQKYLISSKENTPKNKTLNFIIFSFID